MHSGAWQACVSRWDICHKLADCSIAEQTGFAADTYIAV